MNNFKAGDKVRRIKSERGCGWDMFCKPVDKILIVKACYNEDISFTNIGGESWSTYNFEKAEIKKVKVSDLL